MKPIPQTKCPACRKVGYWLSTPNAPFCSRRCKLVDLGKWFNEEHAVSRPLNAEDLIKVEESSGNKPDDSRS